MYDNDDTKIDLNSDNGKEKSENTASRYDEDVGDKNKQESNFLPSGDEVTTSPNQNDLNTNAKTNFKIKSYKDSKLKTEKESTLDTSRKGKKLVIKNADLETVSNSATIKNSFSQKEFNRKIIAGRLKNNQALHSLAEKSTVDASTK
ncbi:MAG: hypothetical protein FWF50_04125 [Defluviitaleaceae bacterium]|nr:hypothetical protein [Defluviitaleaceae bacterium]